MNVIKATHDFERWLAKQIPLVRRDVALKHAHMAESSFSFFRATFYRWLQLWHENCLDVAGAPKVLAIGDLHIENFGTCRDRRRAFRSHQTRSRGSGRRRLPRRAKRRWPGLYLGGTASVAAPDGA